MFERRGAAKSAHSVVNVGPLRRPTAELEPGAAQPPMYHLIPEVSDRDSDFCLNDILVVFAAKVQLDFVSRISGPAYEIRTFEAPDVSLLRPTI